MSDRDEVGERPSGLTGAGGDQPTATTDGAPDADGDGVPGGRSDVPDGLPPGPPPAPDVPPDMPPPELPPAAVGWPDPRAEADEPTANLVAIAVDDPMLAQEGLLAALRLVRRGHLQLEDAAIVMKEEGGRIRIQETRDTRPPQGAATGTWLGMLATLFLAPQALIIGAALGAAAGGIFAKLRDIGLQDDQMKRLGEELTEGSAALLLLVEDAHLFHAIAEARRFHGRILESTCDEHTTERLAEALTQDPWAFPG